MIHPELQFGSRGGSVRAMQQLVSQALHARPGLSRDGIFGPLTKAAVIRFQAMRAIEVDGVVGPQTWAALGTSLRLPQLAATVPPQAHARPQPPQAHPAVRAPAAPPTPRPHPAVGAPSAAHAAPPVARPAPPPAPPVMPTRADQLAGGGEPRWFQVALAEFQAHHTVFGTADGNRRIHEYFLATTYHPKVGTREAWCSAFANWCMREAGIQGTQSAAAASWREWGVELKEPRHGCIMVIHWAHYTSGSGNHVTFFDKQAGDRIFYFGGNQGRLHQISATSSGKRAMARIDYRWPKGA